MRTLFLLLIAAVPAATAADELPDYSSQIRPLMQKYCVNCHNEKKPQGELSLAKFTDEAAAMQARKVWLNVLHRVTGREMPPDDAPQPTERELDLLTKWTAGVVRKIDDATPPQPGRVTMRRLNRVEYRNTVRDLLGIEFELGFDPTRDFPADGAGYGFDNIGDVLSISPLHMEKYLAAAAQLIERSIVVDGIDGPRVWTIPANEVRVSSPTKPADSTGQWPTNWIAEIDVRQAGEYRINATISSKVASGKQAQMALQTEGSQPERFTFSRQTKANVVERKVKIVSAGRRQFWLAYQHEQNKPTFESGDAENGEIVVESLEVSGPYIAVDSLPASHQRLIIARPGPDKTRTQAAEEVLAAFLPRAFRRPVSATERQKYVKLFAAADRPEESFEAALALPLKAALVSPHFLYRVEAEQQGKDGSYSLNDFELASRLSYFLWSTMPDDELLRLAGEGKLTDPAVLEVQVMRLLADPESRALSENFVSQWLQIRGLDNFQPAAKQGKIGTRLRIGMASEPIYVFHEVLTKDQPLTQLIDADYTYANGDLAKHYKLPPLPEHEDKQKQIEKDKILRYSIPVDTHRGGLMTSAAVLTVTSHPDRTSPVKRGKWVLDALLGAPPPPPPPEVEALSEPTDPKLKQSLRERLEAHRTAAACASCHKRMDPLGFAFENYDVLGRWREKDGSLNIDASAKLPDGKELDGVTGLKGYLLTEKRAFSKALTEKLLTYALGRGLEPFDTRAVENIVTQTQADGDKLSRIVVGIVLSRPFRERSSVNP